jgi:4-hydroxy-tetrahydrodipicolinate reductase
MIRIALSGALGRVCKAIAEAISQQKDLELGAAIESPSHPDLGTKIGSVTVTSDLAQVIDSCDIVVDFTNPATTVQHAQIAAQHHKSYVSGTTGLSPDQLTVLKQASATIPLVYAPNMSVGVNLLYRLVQNAAGILGPDFDVEIIETHHRFKKDAPSGTAVRLADILKSTRTDSTSVGMDTHIIHGRNGLVGERPSNEIAVHAVRGGDVVGDHTVIFAGIGERLEITHRAHSRATFANGVIRAIRFVINKPPGLYSMSDVIFPPTE